MKETDSRGLTPKDFGLKESEGFKQPKNESEVQRNELIHKFKTHTRRTLQQPSSPEVSRTVPVDIPGTRGNPGENLPPEPSEKIDSYLRGMFEWRRVQERKQAMYEERRKEAEDWEAKRKSYELDEGRQKAIANLNARLKHPDGTWKKRLPKGWMVLTNNGWAEGYETPYHKLLFAHRDFVYRFPAELHPLANYLFWKERFGSMSHVQPPEMLQGMDEGVLAFLLTLVFELINSKDHPQTKLSIAA